MSFLEACANEAILRSCPACGSSRYVQILKDFNRREGLDIWGTYVRCSDCGTSYLNPVPDRVTLSRIYGDALIDMRDADESEVFDLPLSKVQRSPIYELLRRIHCRIKGRPHSEPLENGEGRVIFDFGCLGGEKLVEYSERGWRVAGLDLNRKGIARAKTRIPEGNFYCQDLNSFCPQEPYDVVRSDNVIEHVLNPKETLVKLRTLLRPNGRILLMVPHGRALSIRLCGKYSVNYWIPFHLNLFTIRSLRYLLEDVGFHDVRVRTFSPNNSLSWSVRQLVAKPGFASRPQRLSEKLIVGMGGVFYLVEVLSAQIGCGEEIIAEARS